MWWVSPHLRWRGGRLGWGLTVCPVVGCVWLVRNVTPLHYSWLLLVVMVRSVAGVLTSVEICAGAGGMALGLERAGLVHEAVVEIDKWACATLRANRPGWHVVEGDVSSWDPRGFVGVDVLAGGVPCPPFSSAGKQLGRRDERDLFPRALQIAEVLRPRAVVIENVRGMLDPRFDGYRRGIDRRARRLGLKPMWKLLHASDFGVPQLRPRVVFVALTPGAAAHFEWPEPCGVDAPTVGEALEDLMAARGWGGARQWARAADRIAPTLVGGSKKHGGPDLGPTRARRAWAALGVEGRTLAPEPPEPGFEGMPRLTVRMAARIQGFPDDWDIVGAKTNAYRQVGNAFPPPVAEAVGRSVVAALRAEQAETSVALEGVA